VKRVFIFLILGPIFGVSGAILNDVIAGRGFSRDIGEGAVMAVLFSAVVSLGTIPFDQYLSHFIPVVFRASLIAVVGAAMAICVILALMGRVLPFEYLMPFAIIGALCMGACSLLSNGRDWL
jgi:hypothetical protein